MSNGRPYLKVSERVGHEVNPVTTAGLVGLIESSITLMVRESLDNVIESLDIRMSEQGVININLSVFKTYRPVVFGKRFANIVCLRKLVANASGLTRKTFMLNVET